MKNILILFFLIIGNCLIAQTGVQDLTINPNQNKNLQYIPISVNGKQLLSNTRKKLSVYETKGHYNSVLLIDLVNTIKAQIRQEISDSLATVQGGVADTTVDNFIGIFADGIGTDPTIFILDDFENYSIDTLIENDTGAYQINIVGYDYDTQDDFTWVSATIGIGTTGFACNFGPTDVFLADDDAMLLNIFDAANNPSELEGYCYIEIKIYTP